MDQSMFREDIKGQLDAIKKQIGKIVVVQESLWESTRHLANSIDVIIRISDEYLNISKSDLCKNLLGYDAPTKTVKPNMATNIENLPFDNYCPKANVNSELADFVQFKGQRSAVNTANNIQYPSTSSSSLSFANTNTQTENISPTVTTHESNKFHEILSGLHMSQNQNDSSINKNIDYTDSNDGLRNPILTMNISSDYLRRKKKEAVEAQKLRRKYSNRYKYIHETIKSFNIQPRLTIEKGNTESNTRNGSVLVKQDKRKTIKSFNNPEPILAIEKGNTESNTRNGSVLVKQAKRKTIKSFNNQEPLLAIEKGNTESNTRNGSVLVKQDKRKTIKSTVQNTSMISKIKVPSKRKGLNKSDTGNKIENEVNIETKKYNTRGPGRRNNVNTICNCNTNEIKSGTSVGKSKLATNKRPTIINTNHESPGKRKKVKSNSGTQ